MDGYTTKTPSPKSLAPPADQQSLRRPREASMTGTSADLLEKAARFDREALAEIYDLYQPELYRYAWRLLGDPDLAEDCVAETFQRFLKALRQGGGPRSALRAYLYRTAHNWITDHYRRTPLPPLSLDENLLADQAPGPSQQVDARIEQAEMRRAFRLLTEEQRQVLVLRFIEDWSVEETAAALQKNQAAVRALQHRALASLRRILQAHQEAQHEP